MEDMKETGVTDTTPEINWVEIAKLMSDIEEFIG